jgi:hypothetical protein
MPGLRLLRCGVLWCALLNTTGCPLVIAGAVGGGAAGAAASAQESKKEDHSAWSYVGAVLGSVVYTPAKVIFAGLGAVTSGVAYLVTIGDSSASDAIWKTSVNGDYVITPSVIEGEKDLHFTGS